MPANEDDRLTVSEAAKELGISETATRRLIKSGELLDYRPTPRKIWILREDLDAFFESHRGATANTTTAAAAAAAAAAGRR